MNGYKVFYNGDSIEVFAESSYAAQQTAVEYWRVKKNKRHMISVVLCEVDGEQITHTPDF